MAPLILTDPISISVEESSFLKALVIIAESCFRERIRKNRTNDGHANAERAVSNLVKSSMEQSHRAKQPRSQHHNRGGRATPVTRSVIQTRSFLRSGDTHHTCRC